MKPTDRKTESNGRRTDGKFGPGNKCAANNRRGHMMALRKALWDCVTADDLIDVMGALLAAAKDGDTAATKILFERLFGRVGSDVDIPEDEIELSADQQRAELLSRFGKLSPEQQSVVRSKLKKPAEQST